MEDNVAQKPSMRQRAVAWRNSAHRHLIRTHLAIYKHVFVFRTRLKQRKSLLLTGIVVAILLTEGFVAFHLMAPAAKAFGDTAHFAAVTSLLVGVGGALIGAAAIAFSLILFALQVNVERMPHGLFRRLSSDARLLGSFALAFSLAATVAAASLIPDARYVSFALALSLTATVTELLLFSYAYRRALSLINPAQQLQFMIADVRRSFARVDRWAKRLRPILSTTDASDAGDRKDIARLAFLKSNPGWDDPARRAITYAMSYAQRFAEQGDYEVVRNAYETVAAINNLYVRTKGDTFFSNSFIIENPLAHDDFLMASLEELRQSIQVAISRRDERQIDAVLKAMTALVDVYAQIDYGEYALSKSHALMAAGYLESAVTSIIPHKMPDVLMGGVRQVGLSGRTLLHRGSPQDAISAIDKLGLLAMTGTVAPDYGVITLEAMDQLKFLTIQLLTKDSHDISYAIGQLRSATTTAAKMMLESASGSTETHPRNYLAPYYSSTTSTSLRAGLTDLTNAVLNAPGDSAEAKRIIRHVIEWSDGIYREHREILKKAVEKRSTFAFDILTWIFGIFEILVALSHGPSTSDDEASELRNNALWLVSSVHQIPLTQAAVSFAESSRVTEGLFQSLENAIGRDAGDLIGNMEDLLLWWTVNAGAVENGWGILSKGLEGLIAASLIQNDDAIIIGLKSKLQAALAKPGAPDPQLRTRVAQALRQSATEYRPSQYEHSQIRRVLSSCDKVRRDTLLSEIADIIGQETPE